MAERIIGGTILLIIVYYVFRDTNGTNQILTGLASSYGSVVQTLQGR